jgi:hypothetical protein
MGDHGPVRAPENESDKPARPADIAVVMDQGSFSHGVCRVCGWSGPGRRSRRRARDDADAHLDEGCAKGA